MKLGFISLYCLQSSPTYYIKYIEKRKTFGNETARINSNAYKKTTVSLSNATSISKIYNDTKLRLRDSYSKLPDNLGSAEMSVRGFAEVV